MLAVIGWKSVLCFSLHIFRALAASCVLHNRTEHSQGFSICQITLFLDAARPASGLRRWVYRLVVCRPYD